jgi:regulator of replication initiation timing
VSNIFERAIERIVGLETEVKELTNSNYRLQLENSTYREKLLVVEKSASELEALLKSAQPPESNEMA